MTNGWSAFLDYVFEVLVDDPLGPQHHFAFGIIISLSCLQGIRGLRDFDVSPGHPNTPTGNVCAGKLVITILPHVVPIIAFAGSFRRA